jgi:hypothetical protein
LKEIKNNTSHTNIDLISGMIQTTQKKVYKCVTIPIIHYVPDLLSKYNLELPKIHLNDFNKGLNDIGELVEYHKVNIDTIRC